MEIKIVVSRLANKYFFITNLAEVDIFVRKNYNPAYIVFSGGLNKKQKESLDTYKQWWNSFSGIDEQTRKDITKLFYSAAEEKEIWNILSEQPWTRTIQTIQSVFKELENPFCAFWRIAEPALQSIQEITERNRITLDNSKLADILEELDSFFLPFPSSSELMEIFLIFCPIEKYQGGKAVSENIVSLEMHELKSTDQLQRFWLLFLHEMIHARYENKTYKEWVARFIKTKSLSPFLENLGGKNVLREIITSLFAARGILAKILFDIDVINESKKKYNPSLSMDAETLRHLDNLRHLARVHLWNPLNEYLSFKKMIDEAFLETAWNVVLEYEKAISANA